MTVNRISKVVSHVLFRISIAALLATLLACSGSSDDSPESEAPSAQESTDPEIANPQNDQDIRQQAAVNALASLSNSTDSAAALADTGAAAIDNGEAGSDANAQVAQNATNETGELMKQHGASYSVR